MLVIPVLCDDCLRDLFPVAVSWLVVTSCWRGTSLALLCRDVPLLLDELAVLFFSESPSLCPFDWLAGVDVVGLEVFFTAFIPRVLPEDAKGGASEALTLAAWISEWGDPTIVDGDGVKSECLVWLSPPWAVVQGFPGVLNPMLPLCKCNRSSKKTISFILLACKCYKLSHIYFPSKKSCSLSLLLSCCAYSEPTQRMP